MSNGTLTTQTYPAATDGAAGYAQWTQIALILFRVELEKRLREIEDYLNEMPDVLVEFDFDSLPHFRSLCRWEKKYRMRELHRLLPFPDVSGRGIAVATKARTLDAAVLAIQQASIMTATTSPAVKKFVTNIVKRQIVHYLPTPSCVQHDCFESNKDFKPWDTAY